MTKRKPSQRYFRALALEPRILLDAAAVTTAAEVAAQAEAPATADAPGVEATPVNSTITITDSTTSFPPVDLFKDVNVLQETNGIDELANLVITIDRTGSNQALVIDGKNIELVAGSGTTQANDNGYVYSVSVSGTTTTITLALNAFDPDPQSVSTLIDTMSYQALDKSVASGTVTVTLKSLSDDGGQTTDLSAIKATVEVDSQVNVPPVISGDILKEAEALNAGVLAGSTEVAYSADGKYVYAAGSGSSISVFEVSDTGSLVLKQTLTGIQDLGTVKHMVVSGDGKSVYTASGSGNLVLLNVNADGSLSYGSTIAVGSNVTGSIAISDDGKQLFVGSQYNGLYVYNRDVDTGALSVLSGRPEGRSGMVTTAGDYVYVTYAGAGIVTPANLTVYLRNANGTGALTLIDSINISGAGTDLVASADGRYLYVATSSGITIYQLGADNKLTQANVISGIQVGSLSLNAEGDRLYVAATNGTVHLYSVADNGSLTTLGTLSSTTNGQEIVVSADGQSVLVSGNGLSRFSSIQTLIRGEEIALASGLTLSDANFDRLASSGDYNGGKLLIERAGGASTNDVFGFSTGNGLTLANGEILKAGEAIATFTQSGGTLTITFLTGTSRDDANAVLRQVTYSNEGSDTNGSVVTLQLRANDGQVDSQIINLDVLLTNNTAPELTTTPVTGAAYDTTGTVVSLFKDTTISTGEIGQSIIQLTLNIDGLDNVANEFIIIAGTRIDLSQSSSGNAGAYSYTYTRNGDSATLVIDSNGMNAASAQTLVNGIAYVNTTTEATTGTRTITLASIRDNGGSAGGGDDTGEPGISASIALAINNAPQWQSDVSDPDRTLYYADGTLEGYADRVTDIVLSADGKTLVISGSTGENAAGTSYLRIYSRDTTTGELTLVQTFTQGTSDNPDTAAIEANGLNAITSMAMHGNNLYLAGNTGDAGIYSLVRFTYDADSGQYSYAGIVATQGSNGVTGLDAQVSEIVISADGKSLYTINGVSTIDGATGKSVLAQFSIDPQSGALTYLGAYQGGSADLGMNAPSGIVVSSDGKSVYVANRSNSMITVFNRDTQTGVLTYGGFINSTTIAADTDSAAQPSDNRYLLELQDIVISPDGKYVYVGSGQQSTLTVFSRDATDGSLTYVSTLSLYEHVTSLQIREIAISSDGSAIYVGFNGGPLAVLSRDSVTGAVAFVSSINVGVRSNQIAVTPDGLNIYSGRSQFTAGVAILSALPNANYVASRPSTPFAEGVSFSDADFDAEDNYQGAELTISRSGTASASDLFGFKNGSGLSLVDNQIMQGSTVIAEFVSADGKLTIRFIAEVDKATANQVLQQVTYRNDSAEPPARVDLKLAIGDGGKATETTLALLLSAPEPVLSASGNETSITIGAGSLPDQVDLFDQVSIRLGEDGEPLTDLVITVDRSGADQALIIDGEEIVLQADSGQTSANGYQYVVEVNDGVTSIRISIDTSTSGATPEAAATLIDGIAYKVLADTASAGTVTITLASLSDTSDQIEPAISASVIVRDQRQFPTLGADAGALDYADLLTQLDANGNNKLQGIQGITVIGDKVYVVRSATDYLYDEETETGSEVTFNTLSVYQRNADGSLQLLENKEVTGLTGVATLHASDDGSTLYLTGADGIALFNATDLQQLGTFGNDIGLVSDVVVQSNKVYVTADSKLLVFTRSGSDLTLADTLEDAGDTGVQLDGANAISLSPDGKTLYVATSGGDTLVSVFSIEADGSLTFKEAFAGFSPAEFGYYASAMNLSADGKTLYVIDNESSLLHVFNVAADGNLSAIGNIELGESGSTAKDVIVSPDGKNVAVIGDLGNSDNYNTYGIFLYSRVDDGSLTVIQKVEGFGDYASYEGTTFSEVRHAVFSADGKQIYLTGSLRDSTNALRNGEGLIVLDLKPSTTTFTENGEPVALLPGGTLADPQLDAAGDYQGSSLVIERNGGPQDGDVFTFLNENGLELKDDGTIWKGGTAIAEFVEINGKLTIAFLAGVSQADAQLVLRQVAYTSSSNDPTRNGDTANFKLVFNDGDGNSSSLDTAIGLVDMNDAAVVETTPLNPTFTTGGDPVELFKDTHIDTIEQGQAIQRVQVTITGVKAGDVLNVLGDQIDLNQKVDWQVYVGEGEDQIEYRVSVSADGVTVVTLYMGRNDGPGRGGAETARIIDSLTYSHTGSESSGTRTISLELFEDVHWQHPDPQNARAVFDGQATVTLEGVRPVSDTPFPELEATGTQTQLEIGNNGLPEAVDLFSDVTVLAGNDGEPLTALTITVSRSGADQALVIDSHEIKLQATDLAQTGTGGYAYSVTINDDGSATIKIHLDSGANAPADVERLVDGMSYKVLADTVADGNVVVTLTGISDYDDADLSISASIDVSHAAVPSESPAIVAIGSDSEIRIGSSGTLPGDVDLFSGVTVSAGMDGSEVERLVITVDRTGDNQALVIGGTQIALTAGDGVGDGYLYEVTVDGDTTTVSLTFIDKSASEVSALIDGTAYRVLDSSAAAGSVTVTLSAIRNSDNIESEPGISAKVTLATNADPVANPGNYTLTDAKAGQNYSIQLPANLFSDSNGDTLAWSIDGLPTGLSFDPVTRTLSGNLQAMGSHDLTIKVSDGWGGEAEIELTLEVVNSEPVANEQFSLGNVTPGQVYEVTLPEDLFTDANDSDLTWEIVELPEWLSYDADSRILSGTAPDSAGSYSISIKASDTHGGSATLTLTLRVTNAEPTTSETVLPELHTGTSQPGSTPAPANFGGPALNAPLFEQSDEQGTGNDQTPDPVQRAVTSQNLLRGNTSSGLADGRGSLSEQLVNADRVLTDSGYQDARGTFSFDGTTLRSSVDLAQGTARSISLQLPVELPDGGSAQRVTLANGLPLPSWASFDARTGELRIDRERLQRDGVLRLTLFSRDAEGKEQRTPVEIRAEGAPARNASEAPQAPAAQVESLPQRLQQETSSALLSEALDLLDQLSDLAGEPVVATTRHTA